jgi:hypothetical protein
MKIYDLDRVEMMSMDRRSSNQLFRDIRGGEGFFEFIHLDSIALNMDFFMIDSFASVADVSMFGVGSNARMSLVEGDSSSSSSSYSIDFSF